MENFEKKDKNFNQRRSSRYWSNYEIWPLIYWFDEILMAKQENVLKITKYQFFKRRKNMVYKWGYKILYDKKFINNRVAKSKLLEDFVPKMLIHQKVCMCINMLGKCSVSTNYKWNLLKLKELESLWKVTKFINK